MFNLLSISKNLKYIILIPLVFASITIALLWHPVYEYFNIQPKHLNNDTINNARKNIDHNILDIILKQDLMNTSLDEIDILKKTKTILTNTREDRKSKVYTNFVTGKNFRSSNPSESLKFASLFIPRILISAYQKHPNKAYRKALVDYINNLYRYVLKHKYDLSMFRNDHATAARIFTYIKIWQIFSDTKDISNQIRSKLFYLAAIDAGYLAKPTHYTAATNHGVMQNIALLEYATAFPFLEQANQYKSLAYKRLINQLYYFISPEGLVLEHSAGYHEFDIKLIQYAFNLLKLNNLTIPEVLFMRYQKSLTLMKLLLRNDMSIPLVGDSSNSEEASKKRNLVMSKKIDKTSKDVILPISGWAIWKENRDANYRSHTTIAWSHYPLGHYTAHDLSINLWANGIDWITNVGYWPYGSTFRSHAESWDGSNAPHYQGEKYNSKNESSINTFLMNKYINFIEVIRKNEDNYKIIRQLILLKPNIWLIIDTINNPKKSSPSITNWTTSPELQLDFNTLSNSGTLQEKQRNSHMNIYLYGRKLQTSIYKGSNKPFAGWVIRAKEPRKTKTLQVLLQGNGWQSLLLNLSNSLHSAHSFSKPEFIYQSKLNWTLRIPKNNKLLILSRSQGTLTLSKGNIKYQYLINNIDKNKVGKNKRFIENLILNEKKIYNKTNLQIKTRLKLSLMIVFLLVSSIIFIFFLRKLFTKKFEVLYVTLFCLQVPCWVFVMWFSIERLSS